jgi:hypothetical protein
MDSLIDARNAVRAQLDARNAADSAKQGGETDPLNAYLDQQQAIVTAEKKLEASFGMSAEAKAKAYADLIDQAAGYNQAVMIGASEVVSAYQAEYDYQANKERMQEKLSQLLDEEAAKRTATAESFGTAMNRAQDDVNLLQQEVLNLETILDRMNNKEINLIFKASGIGEIAAAGGMVGPPNIGQGIESFASSDPSTPGNHAGPGYVGKTGLRLVARGEQILNRNEASAASSGSQTVTIAPVIQISGVSAAGGEKTARELAREIEPELRKLAVRYR